MTGETERSPSGWTIDTLAVHHDVIRQAEVRFQEERDRRYAEVATEREKALKIKETADLAALGLAREIQTYKDEKANELREQINAERGHYASQGDLTAAVAKIEETIKPLAAYVASQSGPRAITSASVLALLGAIGVLAALWFGTHRATLDTPTVVCTATYHPAPCP